MGGQSWTMWVVWCVISTWVWQMGVCSPSPAHHEAGSLMHQHPHKPKLLYIMMDGFRWDYLEKQSSSNLPGFTTFLQGGVRARWTNPLFPSLSYPTWTTLVTGHYAETHGLVGNYFYDGETKEVFSLFDNETTGKQKWWTSEPIWTTAEKAGLKTAQYLWARCDVPIDGITTHYCEYFHQIHGKDSFHKNIMKALDNFDDGYDFVQVFTGHIDHTGHHFGPDSEETNQAVRDLDDNINILMAELEDRELTNIVNIVIVSDHGMAYTPLGSIMRHEVDYYLNTSLVENIADKGALMNIKVPEENIQMVYDQLSEIPGVKVYKKEDIPEDLHFKNGKYVNEIVLFADEGNFVLASNSDKQLPPRTDFVENGAHGYSPDLKSMKGIFFAKGPAFEEGIVIEDFHVVDVYQILTNVLELTPQPHNGTWDHVEPAFVQSHRNPKPSASNGASSISSVLLFLLGILIRCL